MVLKADHALKTWCSQKSEDCFLFRELEQGVEKVQRAGPLPSGFPWTLLVKFWRSPANGLAVAVFSTTRTKSASFKFWRCTVLEGAFWWTSVGCSIGTQKIKSTLESHSMPNCYGNMLGCVSGLLEPGAGKCVDSKEWDRSKKENEDDDRDADKWELDYWSAVIEDE